MKYTKVLFAEHVGRIIKFNWFAKGKIKIIPSKAENKLKNFGYEVIDVNDVLHQKKRKDENTIRQTENNILNNKPFDFKSEPCFLYGNNDVLLQGLEQGKVLTNSVDFEDLPTEFKVLEDVIKFPDDIHLETKKRIMLSCIFEATQEKLPKKKDPTRPAWNFPRDYGINDSRKNELLCQNLLSVCKPYVDMTDKSIVNDVFFCAPLEAHNKKLQFEVFSELVITSAKKLKKMADIESCHSKIKSNIHPVHCTVNLRPSHSYIMKDIYPFHISSTYPYIQTAFLHLNHSQVKNVFEEDVTETQIYSRSLVTGFSIAVAEARALYGKEVIDLPDPVTVPLIQTDGKNFHFTVFQLNTLNLHEDSNMKNMFWNLPRISLYESCEYVSGKPILKNYNPDVIKKILIFLNIK